MVTNYLPLPVEFSKPQGKIAAYRARLSVEVPGAKHKGIILIDQV